ncbi:Ubiquitin-like domain superfamily [Sesbania bispinosa]|nr:Ubiquitin-like domain superfamily [Sesbania bispinosa]
MGGDAAAEGVTEPKTADGGVTINIRCSNGSKFSVQINLKSIVRSFKEVVARNYDIPADQQRLIYKGLEADHSVHLVHGFAPSNATSGTNNSCANTRTTNMRGDGANKGGGLGGPGMGASLFRD